MGFGNDGFRVAEKRRNVAEDIAEAWLAHDRSLREQITQDPDGECID